MEAAVTVNVRRTCEYLRSTQLAAAAGRYRINMRIRALVLALCSLVGCHRELPPTCAEDPSVCASAATDSGADDAADAMSAADVATDTCECKPGEVVPVSGTCEAALEKRFKTCTPSCTWSDDACALPKGWSKIADAPTAIAGRIGAPTVWTGGELIVFGGASLPDILEGTKDGAIYSLRKNAWTALPEPTAEPRHSHTGVWTGRFAVFFGGVDGFASPLADTLVYDPLVKGWDYVGPGPLSGRVGHGAVFVPTTGEMIVWGGGTAPDGAAFDVEKRTWTMLPDAPISARSDVSVVWTGTEVMVWGGRSSSGPVRDGALFNPMTRTWRLLPAAPVAAREGPRSSTSASDFFFFGAETDLAAFDGARLSMGSLTWSPITSPPGATLAPRGGLQAWASGERLFVWSGFVEDAGAPKFFTDGAVYDPATAAWSSLSTKDVPGGRSRAMSVWTGKAALIWGGIGAPCGGAMEPLPDGAIYVP